MLDLAGRLALLNLEWRPMVESRCTAEQLSFLRWWGETALFHNLS